MGSPIGPTLANAFFCCSERKWLEKCALESKLAFYRRYIGDIFVLFKSTDHLEQFCNYCQTCSNNLLCKTTAHLTWPMLSLPKPIPIKSLLHKTATCLTRPATTFFVPQMKKKTKNKKTNCLKQPLLNFIHQRNRDQCIIKKWEEIHIYSISTL